MLTITRRLYRWLDSRLGRLLPDNLRYALKGCALDLARFVIPGKMGNVQPMPATRTLLPAWMLEHMESLSGIEPLLRPQDYAPNLRRIAPDYSDPRMGDAYFRLLAAVPGRPAAVWVLADAPVIGWLDALATAIGEPQLVICEGSLPELMGTHTLRFPDYVVGLSPEQSRQVLGRLCLQLAPERIVVVGAGLGLDLLAGHWLALSQASTLTAVLPAFEGEGVARVLALADQGATDVAYLAASQADRESWCLGIGLSPAKVGILPLASPTAPELRVSKP